MVASFRIPADQPPGSDDPTDFDLLSVDDKDFHLEQLRDAESTSNLGGLRRASNPTPRVSACRC